MTELIVSAVVGVGSYLIYRIKKQREYFDDQIEKIKQKLDNSDIRYDDIYDGGNTMFCNRGYYYLDLKKRYELGMLLNTCRMIATTMKYPTLEYVLSSEFRLLEFYELLKCYNLNEKVELLQILSIYFMGVGLKLQSYEKRYIRRFARELNVIPRWEREVIGYDIHNKPMESSQQECKEGNQPNRATRLVCNCLFDGKLACDCLIDNNESEIIKKIMEIKAQEVVKHNDMSLMSISAKEIDEAVKQKEGENNHVLNKLNEEDKAELAQELNEVKELNELNEKVEPEAKTEQKVKPTLAEQDKVDPEAKVEPIENKANQANAEYKNSYQNVIDFIIRPDTAENYLHDEYMKLDFKGCEHSGIHRTADLIKAKILRVLQKFYMNNH